MPWDGRTERRRHRRGDIRLSVEFTGRDKDGREQQTRIQTLNLSAGGFYAHSNREIPELTRLAMNLVFPPFAEHREGSSVDCEAVVVRCSPDGTGQGGYRVAACFIDIAPQDANLIDSFVTWHNCVYAEEYAEEERDESAAS